MGVVLVLQCVLGVYGGTRLCVGAEWEMCECVEVNEPHRLRCQLSHLPLMSGGAQIRPQHPIPPLTKKHFHFKREKQQTKQNKQSNKIAHSFDPLTRYGREKGINVFSFLNISY